MSSQTSIRCILFDIDGTLVNSNDAHTQAWVDTFAEAGIAVAFERIRPLMGMGGDKLLDELDLGFDGSSDKAKSLSERRRAIFLDRYLAGVVAFPGARELVSAFKSAGLRSVVASSASPQELTPLLQIANVEDLIDHAVGPDETGSSKPDPDIVLAALAWSKTAPDEAVMIGDTVFDIRAANRAGVRCIAFRCGGSSAQDLAAADCIFDDPQALANALKRTPVGELLQRTRGLERGQTAGQSR